MRLLVGLGVIAVAAACAAQQCGPGCTSCDKAGQPKLDAITTEAALKALQDKAPEVDLKRDELLVIHGGKVPGGSKVRFDGLTTDRGVTFAMATIILGDEQGTVEPTCMAVVRKDQVRKLQLVIARVKEQKGEGEEGEVEGGPPQSDSGPFSFITKERVAIVRSKTELDALWADHMGHKSDTPLPPYVDFDKSLLVAYFAGDLAESGVKVVLRPYTDTAGVAHVFGRMEKIGSADQSGTHSQPFAFVEIPRAPAVRFHPPVVASKPG